MLFRSPAHREAATGSTAVEAGEGADIREVELLRDGEVGGRVLADGIGVPVGHVGENSLNVPQCLSLWLETLAGALGGVDRLGEAGTPGEEGRRALVEAAGVAEEADVAIIHRSADGGEEGDTDTLEKITRLHSIIEEGVDKADSIGSDEEADDERDQLFTACMMSVDALILDDDLYRPLLLDGYS